MLKKMFLIIMLFLTLVSCKPNYKLYNDASFKCKRNIGYIYDNVLVKVSGGYFFISDNAVVYFIIEITNNSREDLRINLTDINLATDNIELNIDPKIKNDFIYVKSCSSDTVDIAFSSKIEFKNWVKSVPKLKLDVSKFYLNNHEIIYNDKFTFYVKEYEGK
jgi:hypothetical protein